MTVTARFEDGSAGVYASLEEALDQAVYDEEIGFRKLTDVIQGAHDDHRTVEQPKKVAGRAELQSHRTGWRERHGIFAGVLMPKDEADRQRKAAAAAR